MRKVPALALVFALSFTGFAPASAATKAQTVTAAFKTLLNTTGDSLDAIEQKYESDVDELDATLAAAVKAADATYDQELLAATTLYAPKIAAANKAADDSLKFFNASNKVKVGAGGGFFGGTNLANYLDCLLDPVTLQKYNRVCSDNIKVPVPGTGTLWPTYGWQKDDITTIQLFNAGQELVQNGIAAGYIIPLDLLAFDSSRIANKQALADMATLTAQNGKARAAAQTKRDNSVTQATSAREAALEDLDDAYETAKAELEAKETAASLALLAAKRASKDSNFDAAFVIAYKFEYNRQMVGEIADAAWTGDWTYRTIDSIIKVNKLAITGDSIGSKYSKSAASAFNSAVGNAFTNEPDFRAALKVLTAIYKKTTKTTLKF
jgi:hypothetical protein